EVRYGAAARFNRDEVRKGRTCRTSLVCVHPEEDIARIEGQSVGNIVRRPGECCHQRRCPCRLITRIQVRLARTVRLVRTVDRPNRIRRQTTTELKAKASVANRRGRACELVDEVKAI